MAIQLIYRYHVITSLSDEHSSDTNVEGLKIIQCIIVGEFLVCMLKYWQLAYSLSINKSVFRSDQINAS